jgi:uncharacterized protein with ParB-like and HNH nuclease domain
MNNNLNEENNLDIKDNWYEDYIEESDDGQINEYDITASPNDFNIKTIFDFIESGAVKIPGFQRNYVWDLKRASKLIESIIIGLPIPQIFLYEESRNKFLVIDGQQRLMSVYYFIKQRFPKKEKRATLRTIFDEYGKIPDDILHDDEYFGKFNLQLPEKLPKQPNKFSKLNYSTLNEYKSTFDLRTIRNIIIKQNFPDEDNSSIFEIFNRLNTGGMNLKPQEIRTSLYHSDFYNMLYRINTKDRWRKIIGIDSPDLHMKDIEVMLRSFAMLIKGDDYNPSMTKFLNGFSTYCKKMNSELIEYLESLFDSFLDSCSDLKPQVFHGKTGKFNILLFEAVFVGTCKSSFINREIIQTKIIQNKLDSLQKNQDFINASQSDTAGKRNVLARLRTVTRIFSN